MNVRNRIAPLWLTGWQRWRRLRPAPTGSFRVLLFHDVSAAERESFTRLVRALHAAGRLISPVEAEARLAGRVAAADMAAPVPCLISFDDGFESNLDVAEAVLDPLGVKALFFICPGLTGMTGKVQAEAIATNVFDGKRDAGDLRIMGWDAVEKLLAQGHAIGSHTRDHLRLTALEPNARAEQVEGAADLFTHRLGTVPSWFAYTFGDVDSIDAGSLALIKRYHRYCRSGVRGNNSPATHPLALRADHVDLLGSEAWRWVAVEGGLDPLYGTARDRLDALARL